MNYYYLMASLPTLVPGTRPPLDTATFRSLCQRELTAADLAQLEAALSGIEASGPGFGRAWFLLERQLRRAIARVRATRGGQKWEQGNLGQEPVDALPERLVADAFTKSDPLQREIALDAARWRLLDEMTFSEPFALAAVIAYGMKLQMAERLARLEVATGKQRLDATVGAILKTFEETGS